MTPTSKERTITVTLTGPVGMLPAMAEALRAEGYTVVEPGARVLPAVAARARASELAELVARSIDLWHEWTTTDITDDEDRWAAFSDEAREWLDRARAAIPVRASKKRGKR